MRIAIVIHCAVWDKLTIGMCFPEHADGVFIPLWLVFTMGMTQFSLQAEARSRSERKTVHAARLERMTMSLRGWLQKTKTAGATDGFKIARRRITSSCVSSF